MNQEKIKAFITKYALLKGIEEMEGTVSEYGYLYVGGYYGSFSQNEYYIDKTDAIKNTEQRRLKKIESLKKQIAKLEKMKFE